MAQDRTVTVTYNNSIEKDCVNTNLNLQGGNLRFAASSGDDVTVELTLSDGTKTSEFAKKAVLAEFAKEVVEFLG